LVFTSLSKEAMPIIRYRTRELTALLPSTSRSMRRMAKITGRSDDMMIVRGVNVFPSQLEELILAMPKLSPKYQLTLMRDGHLDSLNVRVEARAELCASLGDVERTSLARELQHRIKTTVGVSTAVSILRTSDIPITTTGKAKRVIDFRNAQKGSV